MVSNQLRKLVQQTWIKQNEVLHSCSLHQSFVEECNEHKVVHDSLHFVDLRTLVATQIEERSPILVMQMKVR